MAPRKSAPKKDPVKWSGGDLKGAPIHFVGDKSSSYLSYESSIAAEQLGKDISEAQEITALNRAVGGSLFGGKPLQILRLTKKEELDQTLAMLEASSGEQLRSQFSEGLIITAESAKTSLRKFIKHLSNRGVVVHEAPVPPKGRSVAAVFLDQTSFNSQIKSFLSNYVGENYADLFPLLSYYRSSDTEDWSEATLEDVAMRIPSPEGTIPAWGLENHFFKGELRKSLELFERTDKGKVVLTLWVVRTKVQQVNRAALILKSHPDLTSDQLAKIFHEKSNYGHKLAIQRAKSRPLAAHQLAFKTVCEYDEKVRGGSSVDPVILMEDLITQLCFIYR